MIITVIAVLVAISVPLTGGRLDRLADIRFRAIWAVLLSLGLQVGITTVLIDQFSPSILSLVHLFTYALAAVFLWHNRRVPGLLIIAVGGIANFLAISANGGIMPASQRALDIAGIVSDSAFENSMAVDGARLQFLGDVFAVPAGWPLSNVFSVGDVVLLVGVAILVHTVGRWPERVAATPVSVPSPAQRCCAATRAHVCCQAVRRGRLHAEGPQTTLSVSRLDPVAAA